MPQTTDHRDPGQVRHATRADLDALVALEQRVFASDRLSRRQFRHHIDSPSATLLVCATDSGLLGDSLLLLRRGSHVARLYSLAVAPAARGGGIGQSLLTANEQTARRRGCHLLRMEVRVANAAAIALYESNGYRRFGQRADGYYADGSDAWHYQKTLD